MRSGPQIELELRFDRKTTAWAKNRIWHPSQKVMLGSDGCLTVSLEVAQNAELIGWILSFGPGVRVLKPQPLAEEIRSTALQIAWAVGPRKTTHNKKLKPDSWCPKRPYGRF
jgi:predicted DNA-binding transcriptional regulator YafY